MFCFHMTKSDRGSIIIKMEASPPAEATSPPPAPAPVAAAPAPAAPAPAAGDEPPPKKAKKAKAKDDGATTRKGAQRAARAARAAAGAAAMRRQVDHRGDGVHDAHHRALQHGPARAARGRDAAELPRAKAQLRPDAHHEEVLRRVLPRQARLPLVGQWRGVRSRVYTLSTLLFRRPVGSATPRPRSRRPRRPSPRRSRS